MSACVQGLGFVAWTMFCVVCGALAVHFTMEG